MKDKGFIPKQIIQFCDNCAGQYKSKGPFHFISESGIPTLCMFFTVRHGKGPADGVVGRIKGLGKKAVQGRKAVIHNAKDFADFCFEKCSHTKYNKDSPTPQYFIQEFFYVTDILRDEENITAVMAPNTRSFYSIRSTGKFCIIEAQEVSCCCDFCVFGDGSDCPNQAYVLNWKSINLWTGKAVVEDFVNLHWDLDNEDSDVSNDVSNTDSNAEPFNVCDVTEYQGEQQVNSDFDWDELYNDVNGMQMFDELEQYVENLDTTTFPNLNKPILDVP